MNQQAALEIFQRYVDGFQNKTAAAADLRISPPYLTDLYRGTRPLTDRLLEHIGLRREVTIKRA